MDKTSFTILSLTPERWTDFEQLFGPKGACAGCWCMYWRQTRKEFEALGGDGNRAMFQGIVESGGEPGVLAYHDKTAVGWCAIAPREEYSTLTRSRVLKPVDDQSVWSVTCFFVRRSFRKQGVSLALLQGAVEHARSNGAKIIEGYPIDARGESKPDVFIYTGLAVTFVKTGFIEVARRSPNRPIMRLALK